MIVLCLFITLLLLLLYVEPIEGMIDIPNINKQHVTFARNKECKYLMNKTIKHIFDKNNVKEDNDWNLYLPCTYNNIDKELSSIKIKNDNQLIFIINNADQLTAKQLIWINLVKFYGREKAKKFMPTTYVLNDKNDVQIFKKEYNKSKIYILKKNIQRQEGLKITNDKSVILNALNDKYIIAQELLQNPYTIDDRKINMRYYMLIICKNNEVNLYVHNNGFIYYTKSNFKIGSLSKDSNITTGYIDRSVYQKNPLTHNDLYVYLDKKYGRGTGNKLFNAVCDMLSMIVNSIPLFSKKNMKENITFQLFGADVAISDTLQPMLMEINKGPDMTSKDERDKKVKHKVITDMFKIMKLLPSKGNNSFVKVLE